MKCPDNPKMYNPITIKAKIEEIKQRHETSTIWVMTPIPSSTCMKARWHEGAVLEPILLANQKL